jgi:hypothetical protein
MVANQKLTKDQKAQQIFADGLVHEINKNEWLVASQANRNVVYNVYMPSRYCECLDHARTQQDCKHIKAIDIFVKQRKAALIINAVAERVMSRVVNI